MQETKPKIFFLGGSELHRPGLQAYLKEVGANEYELDSEITGLEEMIKAAGKACYRSWQPNLNPNVTKVRSDSGDYLQNLHETGHGSVIEHGSVSYMLHDVSRVLTHELVRHRAGMAFSQESLRYVRLTDLKFWIPNALKGNLEGVTLIENTVKHLEEVQKKLAEIYGIELIKDFTTKKKLTSAFRRVAPIGLATGIMITMNLRALRHLIQIRTDPSAEEEIRLVFDEIALDVQKRFPTILGDLERTVIDGYGCWTSPHASMPYDNNKISKLKKMLSELEKIADSKGKPKDQSLADWLRSQ